MQGRTMSEMWELDEQALRAEIVRLNKIIRTQMNAAEQLSNVREPDRNLFREASAADELEATLRENEEIARTLRDSESYFRQLFERHSAIMLLIDPQSRIIVDANPAAVKFYGYPLESLRGMSVESINAQPESEIHRQRQQALKGERNQFVFDHRLASGAVRTVDALISTMNFKGKPLFFSIIHDITERKQAEDKLHEKNRRLIEIEAEHRELLQNLHAGIVVHGPDTRIIFSNRNASKLLGLSEDQLNGKTAIDPVWCFMDEDGKRMPPDEYPVNRVAATGEPLKDLVLGVKKPDGSALVWLLVNAFPEFDIEGKLKKIVVNFHDITERKNAETQIWTEANFDHLTKLPNRRLFHDRLAQEIKKAQRDKSLVVLFFIDLDHFKEINDMLGHDVGDLLLIEAAGRIRHCVRDYDTVARLGGDEFTVILTELKDAADVERIASSIIDRLSAPFMLNGQESFVSASIGIAIYPDDATGVTELIRHADQAMYTAKNEGRGCFRFFIKAMQEASELRMHLAGDLRHALEAGQFEVYYQPVVDLNTARIHKAEALLRWKHPKQGFISPATFIPIAEDTGAIHGIGDWVFMQAAQQARRWQSVLGRDFQISINKSPVQFLVDGQKHSRWIERLREMELPGSSIVIEITEGLLMSTDTNITDKLLTFRDAGVQVAIDDFGTGYSSLAYLKKFDIDYLKIDQSFIRNLAPDSPDFALCEAIVVMAHKLGLKVIAEGVETEQQRDLLQQIGCDYGQGYLFFRAVPAEEFEKLLTME
jgi:diguanylate cyclase (GGDEF)-like protein/PAS domain S-box-containing protein